MFINNYDELLWKGLERHGFLDKLKGIKVTQVFSVEDKNKFNSIAAKDSKLYEIVKSLKCIFYVDRLQGGIYYRRYDFDKDLMNEYESILGENFLGLQMHEWVTVRKLDWNRIRKAMDGLPQPWSAQDIYEGIKRVSYYKKCIHLSCGTPEEYGRCMYPESEEDFISDLYEHYELRKIENNNNLLPADSSHLATKIEVAMGCRGLMPEIGAQTPLTRIQIALTRGMAESNNLPWGCYYEPWGGSPLSVTLYNKNKMNIYNLKKGMFHFLDDTSYGGLGGSSRALQRRLYYYAYMSGARFISEEWDVGNTFYDWDEFDLTPYGEVKKEFLSFYGKHNIGKHYSLFAIVLPKEFPIVDLTFIYYGGEYLDRTGDKQRSDNLKYIRDILLSVFYKKDYEVSSDENRVLTNSEIGDLFDIVYEDVGYDTLSKYPYLIDTTRDFTFTKENKGLYKNILCFNNIDQLKNELNIIMSKELSCTVHGDALWLLNKTEDGWIITIMNNDGVKRNTKQGDVYIKEADKKVLIKFKVKPENISVIAGWPDNYLTAISKETYSVTIKAGGFVIISCNGMKG